MICSIIIATCNRPESLSGMLDHVGAAIAKTGLQHRVIVADNGTDRPAEDVVAQFGGRTGVRLQYLRSEPRNKSNALNAGIGAADTEWLAFTDDDTLPDPDWLNSGMAFAIRGLCRVFGGRILAGQPDAPLPSWMRPAANGEYPGHGVFVRYHPLQQSGLLGPSDRVPFGANVFVRRDVFKEHGGYDEQLWKCCGRAALGAEDGEFGIRLQQRGEPIGYCHEAVVVHPVHVERCRWRTQLRLAFYYGWRDPIVGFDPRRRLVEPYRLRQWAVWSARAAAERLGGRDAAAFADSLKAARAMGSVLCRFSAGYRRRAVQVREDRNGQRVNFECPRRSAAARVEPRRLRKTDSP